MAAILVATAFAQSPKPATIAQTATAPSAAVTAAPKPEAASSPASLNASRAAPSPDAQMVISYLSSVINWYGHLGAEAQLVRDPDETLFFADDRQVAGEVLRLGFDYARASGVHRQDQPERRCRWIRRLTLGRHRRRRRRAK